MKKLLSMTLTLTLLLTLFTTTSNAANTTRTCRILEIHCNATEDITGDDELYLKTNLSSRTEYDVGSINTDETLEDLNIDIKCSKSCFVLYLYDRDYPDADDRIDGEVINCDPEHYNTNHKYTINFQGDGADYDITFKFIN